jgi:hypothetical protein
MLDRRTRATASPGSPGHSVDLHDKYGTKRRGLRRAGAHFLSPLPGSLRNPTALAFGPTGQLFIVDSATLLVALF